MAEPTTTVRWQRAARPGVGRTLSSALLGLVALTCCGWMVIAGHAWLSLLSGCSRWIEANSRQPPEIAEVVDLAPSLPAQMAAARPVAVPSSPPAPLPVARSLASTTGALPGERARGSWPEPLRYGGATCTGVFVYAVTLNESAPRWSAVSLATSNTAPARYARPGQRVEEWEVLSITDDWTGANPVVWLTRDEEVCRTSLTGNPARVKAVQLEAKRRETQLHQEARRRREERRRRRTRRRR
jgi:hypothetical protein